MKYKKFDSDLFDLTDSPAREAPKQYSAPTAAQEEVRQARYASAVLHLERRVQSRYAHIWGAANRWQASRST